MIFCQQILHLHLVAVHAKRLDGFGVSSVVEGQQAGVVVAGHFRQDGAVQEVADVNHRTEKIVKTNFLVSIDLIWVNQLTEKVDNITFRHQSI